MPRARSASRLYISLCSGGHAHLKAESCQFPGASTEGPLRWGKPSSMNAPGSQYKAICLGAALWPSSDHTGVLFCAGLDSVGLACESAFFAGFQESLLVWG